MLYCFQFAVELAELDMASFVLLLAKYPTRNHMFVRSSSREGEEGGAWDVDALRSAESQFCDLSCACPVVFEDSSF